MSDKRGRNEAPKDSIGGKRAGIIVVMLAISVFINYIDRGNLSIASPMLQNEMHVSASQLGILFSAFFWTYAIFLIVSGWLVDRISANWVLAGGFLVWSAATSLTGFLHGFTALLVVRLLLGMGESVAYPSYSKILSNHVSRNQRGFANALIAGGLACGPAFGMLVGGTLMAYFGWRAFFIGTGLVSLMWLGPWLRWMPRDSALHIKTVDGVSRVADILRQRVFWGTCGGAFGSAYLLYSIVAWLPFYLVRERHFSMVGMARMGASFYIVQAAVSIISGRYADRTAARYGNGNVHRNLMILGLFLGGMSLVGSSLVGSSLSLVLLLVAGVGLGLCMANVWPITQILAGPHAAGRWTGLENCCANLAGALTSTVTGFLVERTAHFYGAFLVTAGFCFLSAICWVYGVGQIEPVEWRVERLPTGLTPVADWN